MQTISARNNEVHGKFLMEIKFVHEKGLTSSTRFAWRRHVFPRPASCFSEDLCDEQTCHGGENSLEARTRANDRQQASFARRGFKPSLFQFAINNNKIPVSATGKSKSLDLFQRKHDKQAIQRLKRVRKAQKTTRHCSQHLEQRSTMGNPFSICSTRAHWICMSSLLIRVFISALMHSKGFEWLVNTAPCKD